MSEPPVLSPVAWGLRKALLDFFFFFSERIGLNLFLGPIVQSPPLNPEAVWRASLSSENQHTRPAIGCHGKNMARGQHSLPHTLQRRRQPRLGKGLSQGHTAVSGRDEIWASFFAGSWVIPMLWMLKSICHPSWDLGVTCQPSLCMLELWRIVEEPAVEW